MYLPEEAGIYKIIANNPVFDEINKINPNWFKKAMD